VTADAARATKLSGEDAALRGAALVPALKERAFQAEARRSIPPETVDDIISSGLLRLANPDRYGGCGLDCDTIFEVAMELGRGCGSTAWAYSVWGIHNWVLGHFPEQAQEEYFADPDVISSTSYTPARAKVTPVDGGFRLSGQWDFSSGCDVARWVTVGGMGPESLLWFLVPASEVTIVDTWYVSGLRGTGSKDIAIDNAFVPAHRVLDTRLPGEGKTSGWELHHRRGYRAPLLSLFPFTLASPAIGIAQGAVEEFTQQLLDRPAFGGGRAAESVPAQLRLAESSAEVDAARTILRRNCREILDRAANGEAPSLLDRARYRRDHGFIANLCTRAVDRLFDGAGGHALYDSNPLQRQQRDVHAAVHHVALRWDATAEQYGRIALGLGSNTAGRL